MTGRRIEWRRELLLLAILGMEATWLTPWATLLTGTGTDPLHQVPLVGILALLLGALLVARTLTASALPLALQQCIAGLLAIGSGLALTGALLYTGYPFAGLQWLPAWLGDLIHARTPAPAGVTLLGITFYAWWRSAGLAQSQLTSGAVGLGLRWGILAWLLFHLIGLSAGVDAPVEWLVLFFILGLLAAGLAQVEEVHQGRGAVRSPFTGSWFLILSGAAAAVVGLGLAATGVLSRELLGLVLLALVPLWALVQWALYAILSLVAILLSPLMERLATLAAPAWEQLANSMTPSAQVTPIPTEETVTTSAVPQALLWVVLIMGLLVAVAIVLGALGRRQTVARRWAAHGPEWEGAEGAPGEGLGAKLQQLRNKLTSALAATGTRPYGLATVREIYASLQRLAAHRGVSRAEAETPYEYQRRLDGTWPGAKREVDSITEAYVRAHYGEHQFSQEEIEALRTGWQRLREEIEPRDSERVKE